MGRDGTGSAKLAVTGRELEGNMGQRETFYLPFYFKERSNLNRVIYVLETGVGKKIFVEVRIEAARKEGCRAYGEVTGEPLLHHLSWWCDGMSVCELVCEQESMCVRMCECVWWGKGKVPGYRDKRWLDPRVSPTEVRGHDFVVT